MKSIDSKNLCLEDLLEAFIKDKQTKPSYMARFGKPVNNFINKHRFLKNTFGHIISIIDNLPDNRWKILIILFFPVFLLTVAFYFAQFILFLVNIKFVYQPHQLNGLAAILIMLLVVAASIAIFNYIWMPLKLLRIIYLDNQKSKRTLHQKLRELYSHCNPTEEGQLSRDKKLTDEIVIQWLSTNSKDCRKAQIRTERKLENTKVHKDKILSISPLISYIFVLFIAWMILPSQVLDNFQNINAKAFLGVASISTVTVELLKIYLTTSYSNLIATKSEVLYLLKISQAE